MSIKKLFVIKEAAPPGPQVRAATPKFGREPGKRPGTTRQTKNPVGWNVPLDRQATGEAAHSQCTADELIAAAEVFQKLGVRVNVEDGRNRKVIGLDFDGEDHAVQLADGNFAIVSSGYYDDSVVVIDREQYRAMQDEPVKIGGGDFPRPTDEE